MRMAVCRTTMSYFIVFDYCINMQAQIVFL